ncbi:hypothetical protein HPSA20_0351 [Helicobacter pylori SouthAfrica20]|uniref:Uncharacterized protein n=1 Tax=Helicobacter pylori SouthAfrica20 TaxID=1352356 RepID=T1U9I0_HELPX|nr:hypothetical protein HPSA20_0351 [Helicobacter pylori SouthAfrica20]
MNVSIFLQNKQKSLKFYQKLFFIPSLSRETAPFLKQGA